MVSMAREWADGVMPPFTAGDRDAAAARWDRWHEAALDLPEGAPERIFAETVRESDPAGPLLTHVLAHSPYLAHCLIGDLPFARELFEAGPDAAFALALDDAAAPDAGEPERELMMRLRVAKRRAALAAAMADIASVWPLERVTGALSEFAEAALRAASRRLLLDLHETRELALPNPDDPEDGSGLIVLGMGKLGARELNYSSDIDLIVLYDEAVAPYTGRRGIQRAFTRLAQGMMRIIGSQTAQGYVFRTDLRLRPDPGSTPPAISVRSAEVYYRSAGRNWERAAMIKARPVAGDTRTGETFLAGLRPFIWRRHLDFRAIQDIRAIKRQIDASRGSDQTALEGRNVKLGCGGIREIEFLVQAQQLAWGGRSAGLRLRGTIEALGRLVDAGHVTRRTASELAEAYGFLRRVEHRLQMVDDRQTHSLPDSPEGLADAARFMGFATLGEFSDRLLGHFAAVERHYATAFEDRPETAQRISPLFSDGGADPGDPGLLSALGFAGAERMSGLVRGWLEGRPPALRGGGARELLARLLPEILTAFAESPDPDTALARFDRFLGHAPAGGHLLTLFEARPELPGLVAEIMGAAPRLADRLAQRPILLDSVLSRDFANLEVPDEEGLEPEVAEAARRGLVRLFYAREFGADEMRRQLADALSGAGDFQDALDASRRWANDKQFQLGVHMLRGLLSPVEAGGPLSDIADACIGSLFPALEGEFAAEHGRVPGGRMALIAFGRFGSREPTVSSDLDLLLLYDCPPDAVSDGSRALAADLYHARFLRRLVAAVSTPTAEGRLYGVDMRPRPSGTAGPFACPISVFAARQSADAQLWEHRGLTRARAIHAEGELAERFEEVRQSALRQKRNHLSLADEFAAGRARRADGGADGLWSIERMPGGLADMEAAAQFLQLRHGADAPAILAGDTISVFEAAGNGNLLDPTVAEELAEAARLWRNLLGVLRLAFEGDFDERAATAASKAVIGRSCGRFMFDALLDTIRETAERAAGHVDGLLVER